MQSIWHNIVIEALILVPAFAGLLTTFLSAVARSAK